MNEWLIKKESWMAIDLLGVRRWRDKNDKHHRTNGPAIIYPSGAKEYWMHGFYFEEKNWKAIMKLKNKEDRRDKI